MLDCNNRLGRVCYSLHVKQGLLFKVRSTGYVPLQSPPLDLIGIYQAIFHDGIRFRLEVRTMG